MDSDFIYVYCILDHRPLLEDQSLASSFEVLPVKEYYAAIKHVSSNEFSEESLKKNFADPEWIETHTRNHVEVISSLMVNQAVLPFKFGTVFKSEENLEKFIEEHSSYIKDHLRALEGKEEWSVKIYCDKKVIRDKIVELSNELRELEKQVRESSPGKAFLMKRKKTALVEQKTRELMKTHGQECYEQYKNISESIRMNNLLPRELTERQDDMILNVACFIDRKNVSNFLHITNLQREEYQPLGFSIDVTGPWPPFNFVEMNDSRLQS